MTTTIYLIRHGEVHNPNGVLYGRLPKFGLSEHGKKEIEETAEFLKDKHIDYIFSSPLLRARQTAEIIREKLQLEKIKIYSSLLEVRTSFEGQKISDLSPDQAEVYFSPERKATDETLEQLAMRMQQQIEQLVKKYPGKRIVVVSHGDPLMILRAVLNGLPVEYKSMLKGQGNKYISHGEVVEVTMSETGEKAIKSIFKPTI